MVRCRITVSQEYACDLSMDCLDSSKVPPAKKVKGPTPRCVFAKQSRKRTREIVVEGISFFVDPEFMAKKSDFFRVLFLGNFVEKSMKKIELKDESAVLFHTVLCVIGADLWDTTQKIYKPCIYSDFRSVEHILRVIRFSEKYLFDELKNSCWDRIGWFFVKGGDYEKMFDIDQAVEWLNRAVKRGVRREVVLDIADYLGTFKFDALLRKRVYERVTNPIVMAAIFTASQTNRDHRKLHNFISVVQPAEWECERCKYHRDSEKKSMDEVSWCCHYCKKKFCQGCRDYKLNQGQMCRGIVLDRRFFVDV